VYISNLMTEKGQGANFYVQDFADLVQSYVGARQIDYVLYNTKIPDSELLDRYKREMERVPVHLDSKRKKNLKYQLVGTNLLARNPITKPVKQDKLSGSRTLIRHDSDKLARVLHAISVIKEAQRYLK
jgi:2-phospho-L-lactate transferase/gluconeogenesis factor (CofD/UPF0052 family)